jgi:ABC-2 type transport system ATP-binding protein
MSDHILQLVEVLPPNEALTTEYVVETESLGLSFGPKHALRALSLRIPRGGIHAIVGANGAGKSSLFRILLGVQSPTSGSARILGHNCAHLSARERARIGYVNEEHAMPAWLRVSDVVHLQRSQYPGWDDSIYQRIAGHFHVLPQQRIAELSRGERAGVNLSVTMAQKPELLMLDEPTLGLDVVAKRVFLEVLLAEAEGTDCTILYCSHQMEEVERLADNLIVLEHGELIHMSAPNAFCERVSLWVAEFAFVPPELEKLPGLLQLQRIDGLYHLLMLDQFDSFAEQLRDLGARRQHRGAVNLDRAVNAILSRNHARPT